MPFANNSLWDPGIRMCICTHKTDQYGDPQNGVILDPSPEHPPHRLIAGLVVILGIRWSF